MNYRQKCKTKGKWALVKFYGDCGIYAICQNCGFIQSGVYVNDPIWLGRVHFSKDKLYKYCPQCGLKMGLYDGEHIYKQKEPEGDFEYE